MRALNLVCRAICAALLTAGACLAAEPTASAPAAPKGYASQKEVIAAIQRGEVRLITPALPVPETVTVARDIEYGKAGDYSLKLDLYKPRGLARPVPAILLIHGGAWKGGKRSDYHYYCVKFAERGYVAATMSYRLVQTAPFPAAIQDARCAVRWLRGHAAEHHINPDKIAAMGGSAGGHLAMLLGYAPEASEFESDCGPADVSSRVQAVINFYGPADLTTRFSRGNRVVVDFMGGKSFEEVPTLYKLASPLAHVTRKAPPTLILHGTIDDVVPVEQADTLAARLGELGVPFEYVRLEGWPHTMDLAEEVNRKCFWHIRRFLRDHLGPVSRPATQPAAKS